MPGNVERRLTFFPTRMRNNEMGMGVVGVLRWGDGENRILQVRNGENRILQVRNGGDRICIRVMVVIEFAFA